MRKLMLAAAFALPLLSGMAMAQETVKMGVVAAMSGQSAKSGEAISLEHSRLPWRKGFADVLRQGLVDGSLQQTLVALDIRPIGGSEAVALARLSASEAVLLGRSEGDAFLATKRTVHGVEGEVVERVDSLLHPDHFKLQFNFGEWPK